VKTQWVALLIASFCELVVPHFLPALNSRVTREPH